MPLPADCPTVAVMDVAENIRAKIYAVLGKLGKKLLAKFSRVSLIATYVSFFCFGVHFSNTMNQSPFIQINECSIVIPMPRLHP